MCWGKGPGWEAACSRWELPLALWVPCRAPLLALQGAEERSACGRERWAGPSQGDRVVQAQLSCIKARAGAEQGGTRESVSDGKALPRSPGREAGGRIGKGGMLEAPRAGEAT